MGSLGPADCEHLGRTLAALLPFAAYAAQGADAALTGSGSSSGSGSVQPSPSPARWSCAGAAQAEEGEGLGGGPVVGWVAVTVAANLRDAAAGDDLLARLVEHRQVGGLMCGAIHVSAGRTPGAQAAPWPASRQECQP